MLTGETMLNIKSVLDGLKMVVSSTWPILPYLTPAETNREQNLFVLNPTNEACSDCIQDIIRFFETSFSYSVHFSLLADPEPCSVTQRV